MLGDTEGHTSSVDADEIHAAVASRGIEVLLDQVGETDLRFIALRSTPPSDSDATSADDFVVPEGVAWTIQEVGIDGSYLEVPDPNPLGSPECLAVDIGFWSDGNGLPGDQLFFYEEVAPASDNDGDLIVSVPNTELASGTYWLSVQCTGNLGFDPGVRGFYWYRNANASPGSFGSSGAVINPGGDLLFPEDGWNSLSDLPKVEGAYDFSFELSGISAPVTANEDEGTPGTLALKTAYPNPFSRSAVVEFEVQEPAAIHIAVYDVLGREVAVLVDGPVGGGLHEARLDGSDLPSGTYLIRMKESNGSTHTRQITLAR